VSVSDPARIVALAVSRGARRELMLANLTDAASVVEIRGMSAAAGISVMDARSWRDGAVTSDAWRPASWRKPGLCVALDAYAIVRVIESS